MSTTLNTQHDIDFRPVRTRSVTTPIVEDDPNRGMSDTDMDTILDMESTDTLARTFRPVV